MGTNASRSEKRNGLGFQLLAVIAAFGLSGCLGITPAIRQSIDQSRAVPKGTLVEMPRFSVNTPDELVVNRNDPRRDFLSLRYADKSQGSYNVYPFRLAQPQPDSKRAWLEHLETTGRRGHLERMRIVTEREIEWQGMRAWYHELSFEPSPSETGVAVAGIVVQKGPYHFYINRSLPVLDVPGALTRKLQQARKEYEGFVAGVTLK